jgi:predicted flap endonuclease-1-like 5' DNA nuclease
MIALFVQTLLLMAAAYFVGAALACVVRRSLFARPARSVPAERRVEPLPEVAQRGERFGRPAEPRQPAPSPAPAAVAAAQPAQDLKRIRLIDAALEASLNRLGVRRYEQIAAWMQPDVKRIDDALALKGRVSQENWIEQAQILAKGGDTLYAARRARGEAANAAPTPDEGERRSIGPPGGAALSAVSPRPSTGGAAGVVADVAAAAAAQPPSDASPDVSGRAAFAPQAAALPRTVPSAPGAAVPIRPSPPAARDNLMRISGVDAEAERLLVGQGVTRYSQIALWSPIDVERFEKQLGGAGRIGRENWIEQAQILSRGGDTRFSRQYDQGARGEAAPSPRPVKLADAIQEHAAERSARADIGSLRSVRAEVYQNPEPGPEAAQRVAAQNKVPRSGPRDDLKRIRGIGVLIENRLNAMGVTAYEQIANWTAADIERVSQSLDFKGRIERENWVEQARILASGGATEFSRRVDKGEVETSRYRT